jgi:hypothetical protein
MHTIGASGKGRTFALFSIKKPKFISSQLVDDFKQGASSSQLADGINQVMCWIMLGGRG